MSNIKRSIEETITNECEKICKNMNERITSLSPLIMKMETKFDENTINEIREIRPRNFASYDIYYYSKEIYVNFKNQTNRIK